MVNTFVLHVILILLTIEKSVALLQERFDFHTSKKSCSETSILDLRDSNASFVINRKTYEMNDCANKSLTLITTKNWKANEAQLKLGEIKQFAIHTTSEYIGSLIITAAANRVSIYKVEMNDTDIPQSMDVVELDDFIRTTIIENETIENNSLNLGQMFGQKETGFTFANVTIDIVEDLNLFVYVDQRPDEMKKVLDQKTEELQVLESTVTALMTSNIVTGIFLLLVAFGAMPAVYCYFKRETEKALASVHAQADSIWNQPPVDIKRKTIQKIHNVGAEAAWGVTLQELDKSPRPVRQLSRKESQI